MLANKRLANPRALKSVLRFVVNYTGDKPKYTLPFSGSSCLVLSCKSAVFVLVIWTVMRTGLWALTAEVADGFFFIIPSE